MVYVKKSKLLAIYINHVVQTLHRLPPNVENVLHVVAFHENRQLFRVTLFDPETNPSTKLEEVSSINANAHLECSQNRRSGFLDATPMLEADTDLATLGGGAGLKAPWFRKFH